MAKTKEEISAYNKAYREKNIERLKAAAKVFRDTHKESEKERRRRYYENTVSAQRKDPEVWQAHLAYNRANYARNKEHYAAYNKQYAAKKPEAWTRQFATTCLVSGTGMDRAQVPEELVQIKMAHLKLKWKLQQKGKK